MSWLWCSKVSRSSILGGHKAGLPWITKLDASSDEPNSTPWTVTIQWHQVATYFLTSKAVSWLWSSKVSRSSILVGQPWKIKLNAFSDEPNSTPWTVTIQWHQAASYFLTSKTASWLRSSEEKQKFFSWGAALNNKTKCFQRRTEFTPLNSDDPVAPGGDLFPYVKDSELTTILRSQQEVLFSTTTNTGSTRGNREVHLLLVLWGRLSLASGCNLVLQPFSQFARDRSKRFPRKSSQRQHIVDSSWDRKKKLGGGGNFLLLPLINAIFNEKSKNKKNILFLRTSFFFEEPSKMAQANHTLTWKSSMTWTAVETFFTNGRQQPREQRAQPYALLYNCNDVGGFCWGRCCSFA